MSVNEKITGMQRYLISENIEAAVFFDPATINYFCNFFITDNILIITGDSAYLTADSRYYEDAVKTNVKVVKNTRGYPDALKEIISGRLIKTVGIDAEKTTLHQKKLISKALKGAKYSDIGKELRDQCTVKTEEDISLAKKAQRVTDEAFLHVLPLIRPGVTENEIAAELEYFIRKSGCALAFDTIVVSGRKTSVPHGVPDGKKICKGDFITMDFGARYNGMCSDMTRTIAVGNISERQKKAYRTVLSAQLEALAGIKAGMTGRECDALARRIIDNSEFSGSFCHSLGHGIGYEIHEAPNFSPGYTKKIPVGALMSCEPGIYLEGEFGIRIEDVLVVRKDGIENLTGSEKELIIL